MYVAGKSNKPSENGPGKASGASGHVRFPCFPSRWYVNKINDGGNYSADISDHFRTFPVHSLVRVRVPTRASPLQLPGLSFPSISGFFTKGLFSASTGSGGESFP